MEAKKPFGRSLSDFLPLKPGERDLLEACRVGEEAVLGYTVPMPWLGPVHVPLNESLDVRAPVELPPAVKNCVRADFLRFLLLGGDDQNPVHEYGLMLTGAFVEGELNLRSCIIPHSLMLEKCFLSGEINAQDARVYGVFGLSGSYLADGLRADRLKCEASIFLRDGFTAKGEVRLLGAQVGANLDCGDGFFENKDDNALSVDGANISGSIRLSDGFMAEGSVRLTGVQVGGELNCQNGRFETGNDDALILNSAVVQGALLLRELKEPVCINAANADVTVLIDDSDTWACGSSLDGFRYGAFADTASTNGRDRIKWLEKQNDEDLSAEEFRPQPWRHLQRVLREMGHTEDAKYVGIAYEKQLRKIGRIGQSAKDEFCVFALWRRIIAFILHSGFGVLAAYGYRPLRLVTWMLGVWLVCGGIYWWLAQSPFNVIAPSDPLVFQDARYSECRPTQEKQPDSVEKQQDQPEQADKLRKTGNWPFCSDMPGEYSTFSPWAYSLDLLLPVVDLGQEKSWGAYISSSNDSAADESAFDWSWGHFVRLITWFQILFGWVSSLLLVAIISGFSRRNDEG